MLSSAVPRYGDFLNSQHPVFYQRVVCEMAGVVSGLFLFSPPITSKFHNIQPHGQTKPQTLAPPPPNPKPKLLDIDAILRHATAELSMPSPDLAKALAHIEQARDKILDLAEMWECSQKN